MSLLFNMLSRLVIAFLPRSKYLLILWLQSPSAVILEPKKGPSSQSCGFSIRLWMWELHYKESWVLKNWCFWTVVLEKTLESPLDCKEIQPVHPKGNQSWIFIGRMTLKVKLQYFGHLMWRTDSLQKTLMMGKIEGRRRRGQQKMTWLNDRGWNGWMAWIQ